MGRDGIFPSALRTANVAHALFTTWCAKNPEKSGSYSPVDASASVEDEGSHLNKKISAWRGCRDASESGSREYRSSTIKGTPRVLSNSL